MRGRLASPTHVLEVKLIQPDVAAVLTCQYLSNSISMLLVIAGGGIEPPSRNKG